MRSFETCHFGFSETESCVVERVEIVNSGKTVIMKTLLGKLL